MTYALVASVRGLSSSKSITTETAVRIVLDTEQDVEGDAAEVVGSFNELLHYVWTADKQVPIGARLCTSLKLLPLQRLAISTIQLTLQEKSTTNTTHNPVSRRWQLLKLQSSSGESLVPMKPAAICSTVQSKENLLPDLLSAAELSRANGQCPRDELKLIRRTPRTVLLLSTTQSLC